MLPADLPPPAALTRMEEHRPTGPGYAPATRIGQEAQQPEIRVDLAVEVVGNLPLQAKVEDVTRRLTRRQQAGSMHRIYPPTILELITLVNRNPEKPRGKAWDSIMALTMRYDEAARTVSVEYCVDYCGRNKRTGGLDPKRRMAIYRAPEAAVVAKVDKKLRDLAKYADR